jgi:PKD repeat protein
MRSIVMKTGWARRQLIVAACVFSGVLAGGAALGQAKVVHANGQTYGVMYAPGHGATPGGASSPLAPTIGPPQQEQLTYGDGPLMLTSKLYLIFWGKSGSFAASYENPIIQWAKDLAVASTTNTDEFSVTRQYKNAASKSMTGQIVFGGAVNDTRAYPAKTSACASDSQPCIMDAQLQTEITNEIAANKWPTDPAGAPEAQYIVLFPNGVDGCIDSFSGDCTYQGGYCGYHGAASPTPSTVAIYTNLPYESGCDSGQAPSGVDGNADTDGSLDTLIHEVAESATDPENGSGYTDADGNEIGDKCDGQSVSMSQSQIYGTPLGGSVGAFTAFNQQINAHTYYTQTLWSNESTKTPAGSAAVNGCAQRLGPSPSSTAPSTITTGTAVAFNGGGSYDLEAPIASYTWNFGDGSPALTTTSAKPTHIYDKASTYTVRLTVADATGSANRSTQSLPVKVTGSTRVPSIAGFSPSSGATGSAVTISGSNLASASTVTFNGLTATISSDSATQIKAVVPNGASTGAISVTTSGGKATSSSSFRVT